MSDTRPKNAISHGLYASEVLLPGENKEEFEALHQAMRSEWEPDGASEEEEVFDLCHSWFVKRRLRRWFQSAAEGNATAIGSLVPSTSAAAAAEKAKRQETFDTARSRLRGLPPLFNLILENLERPDPDIRAIGRLTVHAREIIETMIAPAFDDLNPAEEKAANAAELIKATAELVKLESEVNKGINKKTTGLFSMKAHKELQQTKKQAKLRQLKSSPPLATEALESEE
jgi:hypothetical protein